MQSDIILVSWSLIWIRCIIISLSFQFVSKASNGKLQIFKDNQQMEEFDFVIWGGLLPDFARKSNLINYSGKWKAY